MIFPHIWIALPREADPSRFVYDVSLQTGIGSCRRPVGQCQNLSLWQKIPQPQDISAKSYNTHNTPTFLQPTLCPHFFSAYASKITGLQAACLCSLSAATVVPGKHNQKQQVLCWHKLRCKRSHTKSRPSHHSQLHHPLLSLQSQWILSLWRMLSPVFLVPATLLGFPPPHRHKIWSISTHLPISSQTPT